MLPCFLNQLIDHAERRNRRVSFIKALYVTKNATLKKIKAIMALSESKTSKIPSTIGDNANGNTITVANGFATFRCFRPKKTISIPRITSW